MSNDIIAAIDGAIEDWTTSSDAMRWTPDPPRSKPLPPPAPRRRTVIFETDTDRLYRWTGNGWEGIPTHPDPQVDHSFSDRVYDWLEANGLGRPDWHVPLDAKAYIERGRQLVCEVFQSEDGKVLIDDTTGDLPPYRTVIVPLMAVPQDPEIRAWLGYPRGVPAPLSPRHRARRRRWA